MMSYDQSGQHSTLSFAQQAIAQALHIFPREVHRKVTHGIPFYSRDVVTGDWKTYEDIVQRHHPLPRESNEVMDPDTGRAQFFNGYNMIAVKTGHAIEAGLAGVMIWELGSDCRKDEVQHADRPSEKHVATCPDGGPGALLDAVTEGLANVSAKRNARADL
jgi:GH18 family chitinase